MASDAEPRALRGGHGLVAGHGAVRSLRHSVANSGGHRTDRARGRPAPDVRAARIVGTTTPPPAPIRAQGDAFAVGSHLHIEVTQGLIEAGALIGALLALPDDQGARHLVIPGCELLGITSGYNY